MRLPQPQRIRRRLPATVAALLVLLTCRLGNSQTIINVPPSPSPSNASAGTTVNLLPGGTLANFFNASGGSTLNVNGGTVGTAIGSNASTINMISGHANVFVAEPGSLLEVQGGTVDQIQAESTVNIRGGRLEFVWDYEPTADVNIFGGAIERLQARRTTVMLFGLDFKINGVPTTGLANAGESTTTSVPPNSVLTGILADGRAFAHYQSPQETDPFVVEFVRSATPISPTPSTTAINSASTVEWIGAQQAVSVGTNGSLVEHFRAGPGSRIDVEGGRVYEALHAVSAEINLGDGYIGRRSKFFEGTVVNVSGGQLEDDAKFFQGTVLNATGGQVAGATILRGAAAHVLGGKHYSLRTETGGELELRGGEISYLHGSAGSTLNIHGGRIIDNLGAGGIVNLYGGEFTDYIGTDPETQLTIHATELRRNGIAISGLQNVGDNRALTLSKGDYLSGVFANGTPFVLGGEEYDLPPTVQLVQSSAYATGATTIHVPTEPSPQGVHHGQHLILDDGGALPSLFTASHGSMVEIRGGTVGFNFEAIGAEVDISGGRVSTLDAFAGATVDIGGTAEWSGLEIFAGGTANISGGLGNGLNWYRASKNSTLNISGGEIRGDLEAEGATVNVSGGRSGGMALFRYGNAVISGGEFTRGISVMSGSQLLATGGTLTGISTSLGDSDLSGIAHTKAIVDGATVASLRANDESEIEVRSGIVGDSDAVGGKLVFRGGALGDSHEWIEGSVELHGYNFQVDGVPVAGLDSTGDTRLFNYSGGAVTGTLSDGTPFNIVPNDNFQQVAIRNGVLRLVRSTAPTLPATIVVPAATAPYGASEGQTVVVEAGGRLGDNFLAAHGSTVEVRGGEVGSNFEADRSQVMISGGAIGNRADIFKNAVVTMTGGSIGEEIEIHSGGVLNISGGQLGRLGRAVGGQLNLSGGRILSSFQVASGSTAAISGGYVENEFAVTAGGMAFVSGGEFQSGLQADSGAKVVISGGSLGLDARGGSQVEIHGGSIRQGSTARENASVVVSGGSFGDSIVNQAGEAFAIHGVDFKINGVPVEGFSQPGDIVNATVGNGQLFSGTLSDGTPFAFTTFDNDSIGHVRLVQSAPLPAAPASIEVPSDVAPRGIRNGQTLTLLAGGSLPENFGAGAGSTLHILGGQAGRNLEAVDATVHVGGGVVEGDIDAFLGTTVHVDGGKVNGTIDTFANSLVEVVGGDVSRLTARTGSEIQLTGGYVGELIGAVGAVSQWRGGVLGRASLETNGVLEVHGFGFRGPAGPLFLDETAGESQNFNIPNNSYIMGTLEDGTPFSIFTGAGHSQLASGALKLITTDPVTPSGPAFQVVNDDQGPRALGAGQRMQVAAGGALGTNFVAGEGSRLELVGGSIQTSLKAFGADLLISSGSVGQGLIAGTGTVIVMNGGELTGTFYLRSGSKMQIYGGQVANSFAIEAGTQVDIYGRQFFLNGQPLAGFDELADTVLLRQREGQLLTAILADGSTFEWRLNGLIANRPGTGISAQARLQVHLVPEPGTAWLCATVSLIWLLGGRRKRIMTRVQD